MQALTVTAATNWAGVFNNLPKYNAENAVITYTITEDPITNYHSEITGDITNGFIATNTELTSIPVEKKWEGTPATAAIINLTVNDEPAVDADGNAVAAITLNEAGNWQGSFGNLPKYDTNNALINYVVKETPISGYTSSTPQLVDGTYIISESGY